jgi:DNA repair protein RecO (recombination protein O)
MTAARGVTGRPPGQAVPAAAPSNIAAGRRRSGDGRVDHQPGFVLHATPWRETSLILDVLTLDHGRVALVARGAKRPTSHLRGLLSSFAALAVSWTGRGEVQTLVRVEWQGTLAPPRGDALLAAFYVNELLVRLLPRGDAHPGLYASYVRTLGALARLSAPADITDPVLRAFELDLLRETGLAPRFDTAIDELPVQPGRLYRVDLEHGVVPAEAALGAMVTSFADERGVDGAVLLALAQRDFANPALRMAARDVLRRLIRYHLQGRPLNTRRIFEDLKAL